MTTPNRVRQYEIGDMVQLVATVIGSDGVTPAQPSYFAFLVKDAYGTVATYATTDATASVLNPTTGVFLKDISVLAPGSWFYRAQATGHVQAAEEFSFLVRRSFIL